MELLRDRRVIVAAGGALVALLAVLLASWILHRDKPSSAPPPASEGGLVIEMKSGAELKRDPNQQYRCFNDGQYVGMATLEECARRNGVVSGALDVGVDETGALAASSQLGPAIAPLPPPVLAPPPAAAAAPPTAPAPGAATAVAPTAQSAPARAPSAPCQRYDRGWTSLGETPLMACLQMLFAGRCERAGSASYGRWGDQTLRLVPGRIEQSRDDRSFRTLVEQGPGCSVPQL